MAVLAPARLRNRCEHPEPSVDRNVGMQSGPGRSFGSWVLRPSGRRNPRFLLRSTIWCKGKNKEKKKRKENQGCRNFHWSISCRESHFGCTKKAGTRGKLGSQKRLAGLSKGDYSMRESCLSSCSRFHIVRSSSEIPGNIIPFSGRVQRVISNDIFKPARQLRFQLKPLLKIIHAHVS